MNMLEMLERSLNYYQNKLISKKFDEIDNLRLNEDYKKLKQVKRFVDELIKSYEMLLTNI